jgi:peptidoglycan/LPS O-acetylase OafA/YrhL
MRNRLAAWVDRLLKRLGRVTSSGLFLPEIDGLRTIAIVSVIAFHVQKYVPRTATTAGDGRLLASLTRVVEYVTGKGFFGVELFFVISGFILSLPFATHHLRQGRGPSLPRYYQRRLLRLEPPYFISLAICFGLLVAFYGGSARALAPHLAASAVYVREFVFGGSNPINGVLWSLECEVQFYVLAPLLAKVYLIERRWLRRTCIMSIPVLALGMVNAGNLLVKAPALGALPVLGTVLRALAHLSPAAERVILLSYVGYFCAGLLLADVFVDSWEQQPRRHWRWDVVGAIALGTLLFLVTSEARAFRAIGDTLPFPLLVFVAYVGAFRGPVFNAIMRNRWMVTIGGMCYTEYLYHQFFLHMIEARLGAMTGNLLVPVHRADPLRDPVRAVREAVHVQGLAHSSLEMAQHPQGARRAVRRSGLEIACAFDLRLSSRGRAAHFGPREGALHTRGATRTDGGCLDPPYGTAR